MNIIYPQRNENWQLWQTVLFRFFFIYFVLYSQPLNWFIEVPYLNYLSQLYASLEEWIVTEANVKIFHLKDVLTPINGSGDTSYAWAQCYLFLSVAGIICILWTFGDYKKKNYNHLNYWLCILIRYHLILMCFLYGITKLFFQQMPFPNYSQMITPLGDFSSQRLMWMFMGYSGIYQFFAGSVEVLAALFLFFKRIATLGVLLALGIFFNIVLLNLSYDVPIKLLSSHLLLMCLYLLAQEYQRLWAFFITNQIPPRSNLYNVVFSKKWMFYGRKFLKTAFLVIFAGINTYTTMQYHLDLNDFDKFRPIEAGIYEVTHFVINQDTLSSTNSDARRWRNIIFEKDGNGSINILDTLFRQRYKRSYFYYIPQPKKSIISFKKSMFEEKNIFSLQYKILNDNRLTLQGKIKTDSIYLELKKNNREFELMKQKFHWLSENPH